MSNDKKIPLVEMFGPTIQGEGAVIGQQTYFIRFGLCDYKCVMCDSMNAVDPKQVKENAEWLTQEQVFVKFYNGLWSKDTTRWLTLSGGNPCIHDLGELVDNLHGFGFRIAVETQGTKCPAWLPNCDLITISPKGPGMGENTDLKVLDGFLQALGDLGQHKANFKVVVFDQRDLEFVKLLRERYVHKGIPFYLSLGNPWPPGLKSPLLEPADQAEYVMTQINNYKILFEDISHDPVLSQMRFLPQWHTLLWGHEKGR